jgi:hypothetical protein
MASSGRLLAKASVAIDGSKFNAVNKKVCARFVELCRQMGGQRGCA